MVRWAVSLGLLGLLLTLVDLGEISEVFQSADATYLVLAVVIMLGDRVLMAGKWLPLLWINVPDVSAGRAVRAYFAASFAALFLPASVGGDALRAYGVGKDRDAVMEVGASVLLERVLGVFGSGVVALLILWVAARANLPMGPLFPLAVGCALVGIGAAGIPFSSTARKFVKWLLARFRAHRWQDLVERFGSAYGLYRGHPRTLVVVAALSVVEQLVSVGVYWAAARALQLEVPFEALFVAVPLSMFVARIPVGIAGIGILEGGLVYLLGLFGIPGGHALSLSLAGRLVEFAAVLPGALWWRELTAMARGANPAGDQTAS